jgi:hypothetical protein
LDRSFATSIELPAQSWRKLSMTLGAIAVAEALVIVVAAIVLVAKPFAHHLRDAALKQSSPSFDKTKTGPDSPAGKAKLTRRQTVVMVLNGNGRSGAAGATAGRLRHIGYRIGTVGNARRTDYPKSLIMYKGGYRPEAIRLAHEMRVKIVGPLDGIRPKAMGRADVAYVVGAS